MKDNHNLLTPASSELGTAQLQLVYSICFISCNPDIYANAVLEVFNQVAVDVEGLASAGFLYLELLRQKERQQVVLSIYNR